MSLVTVVDVGSGVFRILTMHYSEVSDFLRGAKNPVDVESSSDNVIIVVRSSKTVVSSQNLVRIPKDWRTFIL